MLGAVAYRLARRLSIAHLARHRGRTVLTIAGIGAGVAMVVAVADVNDSVLAAFTHTVRTVAGDCELEVSSSTGPFSEEAVAHAAAVAGVEAAAGMLERFVPLADDPAENVYLLGADFLGSSVWRSQLPLEAMDIADKILFVSQLDSVVVPRAFAERRGLREGSEIRVVTPGGPQTLRVRGFVADVPVARLFGGALAIMDLPAAQRLLGENVRIDRAMVKVREGLDVQTVQRSLATALGPAYEVAAPEDRGDQTEKLLTSLRALLATSSLSAVAVGCLIVYQTILVSLWQRRRQLALANAVGVPRGALVGMILLEAATLGGIGGVLGIGVGRQLAALIEPIIGGVASEVWLRIDISQAGSSPIGTSVGLVVGVGTALLSAAVAVAATFRAPTVEALRPVGLARERMRPWPLIGAGILLLSLTWLVVFTPPGLSTGSTVAAISGRYLVGCLAAAVLAPVFSSGAGTLILRVLRGGRSVSLRLAAASLRRTPARAGSTITMIVAAVSLAVTLAGLVKSFQHAWLSWIEQHFASDLIVGAGGHARLVPGRRWRPPLRRSLRRSRVSRVSNRSA